MPHSPTLCPPAFIGTRPLCHAPVAAARARRRTARAFFVQLAALFVEEWAEYRDTLSETVRPFVSPEDAEALDGALTTDCLVPVLRGLTAAMARRGAAPGGMSETATKRRSDELLCVALVSVCPRAAVFAVGRWAEAFGCGNSGEVGGGGSRLTG